MKLLAKFLRLKDVQKPCQKVSLEKMGHAQKI
jgi:hypothetical protein